MLKAAEKFLASCEYRRDELEAVEEMSEKQESQYAALEEVMAAVEEFIEAYKDA